ncbi:MAG: hypothetical protein JXR95_10075 [Deltaproteobacteria bacterium]|nr:hypothetical protein [Deltaproteobacteria bacterium]
MKNTISKSPPSFWQGHLYHMLSLSFLIIIITISWTVSGQNSPLEFWSAVSVVVVHQFYVWVWWRRKLNNMKALPFGIYHSGFMILFLSRFISLFLLSDSTRGTLHLPTTAVYILSVLLFTPSFFAMYSVVRYFGLKRATGADHYFEKYRMIPHENRGIFRFTSNGMYVYAFLMFWGIALSLNSLEGLIVAAFSHAYIWVHFILLEKPDMNYLYGTNTNQ